MLTYESALKPLYDKIVENKRIAWKDIIDKMDNSYWEAAVDPSKLATKSAKEQKAELKKALLETVNKDEEEELHLTLNSIVEDATQILNKKEAKEFESELTSLGQKLESGKLVPKGGLQTSIAESFALTSEFLGAIEKIGNHYYNEGKYKEARRTFQLLTQINPLAATYWLSLGHSERQLGHVNEAITAFYLAGVSSPNDPVPFLIAAYLSAPKDKVQTSKYLNLAREIIDKRGEQTLYKAELKEIEEILKSLP